VANIPANSRATIDVPAPDGEDRYRRWFYLISGDLSVEIEGEGGAEAASMTENGFLAWRNTISVASADRVVSEGGCIALCVGHQLGHIAAAAS